MWWFRRRHALTDNVAKLLASAQCSAEKLIEWMRVDAALIRCALKHGGDADLTVPDDNIRILLAEQLAAVLMAKENLMLIQGKSHFFHIRPIYVPIDPNDLDECVAKVWALIWPDCRYPRYERLTPEQRYICFGPDGEKRFGPAPGSRVAKQG
jgi:hypothetical protein